MTTNRLREVDLERGMPTVRAALQQLSFELWRGRSLGCAAVKLIHGYGSSGKGGRIRVEARACLARMKERGELRDVSSPSLNPGLWRPFSGAPICGRTRIWSGTTMGSPWWCYKRGTG